MNAIINRAKIVTAGEIYEEKNEEYTSHNYNFKYSHTIRRYIMV